jgi:D-3-phosphoglycerate dehydrogenase
VVVGDHFIPAEYYVKALREICGPDFGPVTTVDWAGDKKSQHTAQQRMEWDGPEAAPAPTEIIAAVADAEVLALHFAPVPKAVLDAAPRLKAVVVARAGLENVDREAAKERGIEVFGVAGRNASAVAELAIGLMLSEARDIARADASIKTGGWRKEFPSPGQEIGSSTVGLVGFGHVGRHLAGKLRGFAPRLLVHDPFVYDEELAEFGAERAELPELFAESDFLSLQARVTAENERFIGAELLGLMKPTSYFLNVGRSRLLNYDDLYRVLAEGRIAGAALDVYDAEPLPVDSPWRKLDNVTLTPHYAGDTLDTNRTSARLVAERIASL